jgi:hypothetical protein
MGKTLVMESIVSLSIGQRIPVIFRNVKYCSIKNSVGVNEKGEVVVVEPKIILIGNHSSWENILDYLTVEQQMIWQNFSPLLFCILHEVGHSQTLRGLKYREIIKEKEEIVANSKSAFEMNKKYREVEDEKRADQWATEWVVNNLALAKKLDKQIRKYYK